MKILASVFAVTLLIGTTTAALAGSDVDPASKKALQTYVLTMPKVKAFDTATTALMAAAAKDPSLAKDREAAASEHTNDINGEYAKMDHHPRVFAFYQKQGLTKQDVILIPLTLMAACMAVQYPSAAASLMDQTSTQQIGFCKANQATINGMKSLRG